MATNQELFRERKTDGKNEFLLSKKDDLNLLAFKNRKEQEKKNISEFKIQEKENQQTAIKK